MIPLIVVLVVLAVIVGLLLSPVFLIVKYENGFVFKVKFLFFTFTVYPRKKKAKNKTKGAKKTKQNSTDKQDKKSFDLQGLTRDRGISGFIELINQAAIEVKKLPAYINKHLIFTGFDVDISVASEDAADTAVTYGKTCAVVYPAVGIILNILNCKSPTVSIYPDFKGTETKTQADFKARISLLYLIISAIKGVNIIIKITRLLSDGKK